MFQNPSSHLSEIKKTATTGEQAVDVEAIGTEIAALRDQVAKIAEYRARQAQRLASAATDKTRDTISDYPLASLSVAFAAGAVIGLIVMEGRSGPQSKMEQAKDELDRYARRLRKSVGRAADEYSISDRLDRVAGALSTSDAKEKIAPTIDRVLGWLSQAKDQAQKTVAKVTPGA